MDRQIWDFSIFPGNYTPRPISKCKISSLPTTSGSALEF